MSTAQSREEALALFLSGVERLEMVAEHLVDHVAAIESIKKRHGL
jgi:hypothetical protein